MPIPIAPIIALIDAAIKIAELIKDSGGLDPTDKAELIRRIRAAQERVKEWE